jgi:hypothetical protein
MTVTPYRHTAGERIRGFPSAYSHRGTACREEMGHSAAHSRNAARDDLPCPLFLLQETRERDAVQGDKETEHHQVIGRVDLPDKPCQNEKDRSHVLSSLGLVGLVV